MNMGVCPHAAGQRHLECMTMSLSSHISSGGSRVVVGIGPRCSLQQLVEELR